MRAPADIATDVLVVGAGPAGLAAAAAVLAAGHRVTVVEPGSPLRDRDHARPEHLANGVGGCGLFSDGKFSFFPSASRVWTLKSRDALRESWEWLVEMLGRRGLAAPTIPASCRAHSNLLATAEITGFKQYPSAYLPFDQRHSLIEELESAVGDSLRTHTAVQSIAYQPDSRDFTAIVESHGAHRINAQAAVVATGRFGPLSLSSLFPDIRMAFRRFELGVRIVQPAASFFLAQHTDLDPKLILRANGAEWRTFCCCRHGEVVATSSIGLLTVSGRADGQRTSLSNIGFNLRVSHDTLSDDTRAALLARLHSIGAPVEQSLNSFIALAAHEGQASGPVAALFGEPISALLRQGLNLLVQRFPSLSASDALLVAPALEGVGHYPQLDDLRASPYPLWIAGDCSGHFRGLTAAMVSGYYCGRRAHTYLAGTRDVN